MTARRSDGPALLEPTMRAWVNGRRVRGEISERTFINYSKHIDMFTRYMGPDTPLAEITTADIEDWLGTLTNRLKGHRELIDASTRNTYMSTIRSFYGWAAQRRIVDYDPTLTIRKSKVGARPVKRLQHDQVAAVLAAGNRRSHALVTLAVQQMLRLSELQQLTVEDWNRREGTLLVKGKGNKHRVIPLTAEATEVLTDWVGDRTSGPMWPSTHRHGKAIGAQTIRRAIQKPATAAGVRLTPHQLRHTGASDAAAGGASLASLRDFLGHASLATTSRYTWTTRGEMLAAADGRRYGAGRPAIRAEAVEVLASPVPDFT